MNQIENEIIFEYIRASGPGGQNVNKVTTAVQLRFNIVNSPSLREDIKSRLIKLAGRRVSTDGILIIEARRYRSQEQNRSDAIKRFRELLRQARTKPSPRKKTNPSHSSIEERLQKKKKRGELKKLRESRKYVE
jgi:ribosome-associated protein